MSARPSTPANATNRNSLERERNAHHRFSNNMGPVSHINQDTIRVDIASPAMRCISYGLLASMMSRILDNSPDTNSPPKESAPKSGTSAAPAVRQRIAMVRPFLGNQD